MRKLFAISVCISVFLQFGCKENIADRPLANQKPRTFLWLFPDSTIGVGISRQHLRWWGEDPDGVVVGYLFAFAVYPDRVTAIPNPDTLRYTFVTTNDTLFAFPLDTLFRNFTVFVRAVDNTFTGIPHQSIVRMLPRPYRDKNDDGVLNGDDQELPTLMGAVDPTGVVQTFPVRNTPPTVEFARNPNDPDLALKQPDTTYTVATFAFKGHDFDGDNTLVSYRIALNDTSNVDRWVTLSLLDTIISIVVPRAWSDAAPPTPGVEVRALVYRGKFLGGVVVDTIDGLLLDALNVFYVQSKDIAGEFSQALLMPLGSDHWYVRRPRGRLLMVSDMLRDTLNPVINSVAADSVYRAALSQVPGGGFAVVDRLDIALGLDVNNKRAGKFGRLMPAFQDPALIYTFLLYDYVFWYTDHLPSLSAAQVSLFEYLRNGGKVIFSSTFESAFDPGNVLRDIAPIDSVGNVGGDNRTFGSYMVFADSSDPLNLYPNLQFNGTISTIYSMAFYMRPVYRRSDARYIYHLQASHLNRYPGTPNIGVVDGQRTIVFIGLPLHLLNNTTSGSGLTAFFTKTLTEGFRPLQKIDRTKY
jgi:hypothetical protein